MPIYKRSKLRARNRGDAKGLFEAISNGFVDGCLEHTPIDTVQIIREHILDFIAQKFSSEIMNAQVAKKEELANTLKRIWEDIKNENEKETK